MKSKPKQPKSRGFALVVALSLMILLTIIAVGLLTLSATALRSATQGEAMAAARNHARLAMILAIGDLQKTAGPDRAVTVPASQVNATHPHGVTGVWEPWDPGMPPDARTNGARDSRFRQWLVSTRDGSIPNRKGDLPLVKETGAGVVALLGEGSLGDREKRKSGEDQRIHLPTTTLTNKRASGGFAWAVIDESAKARLDLYEEEPLAKHSALARAGTPPVDGVLALDGLDGLKADKKTSPRLITMRNAELHDGAEPEVLRTYSPDITVQSSSLMTDVVSGGLKRDLSLWFSKGLSSAEKTGRLYAGSKVVAANYPADPPMSLLETYHQYYKNFGRRAGLATPRPDGVAAKVPARYLPIRGDLPNPAVPTEPVMVPTVLRVDVIFSLVSRDAHGGRVEANLKGAGRPYMLHLLYLPVVTLHNPYNVPLAVEGMKITFKNIPIGFQFLVDGQPVTTSMVPLNQLYSNSEGGPGATKDFSCTLSSVISTSSSSTPFELKPGQTKIFGTPKVSPEWTWANEQPGVGVDGTALFDWRNNQTSDFSLAPKLMTDPKSGAGFDIDWLAPRPLQTDVGRACGVGEGIVALRGTERIGVNFGPFAPPAGNGSFNVNIQLRQGGGLMDAGAFSVRYGDATRLKAIFEKGTSLRYPTVRSFPETFPRAPLDRPFTVAEIYEANSTKIKEYLRPRPFVIFSLGSRTTKESFLPTRIIADENPTMNVAKIDLSSDRADPQGGAPLEMVMMPIRNGNAAIEDIRDTEEAFAFGGNGTLHGTQRATIYELPRMGLQSLAQFRHANLAGSGFMPMTTYTAGESLAHPLIGTETTTGTWTDRSVMLDHTWHANEALWDRYFLSSIADQPALSFSKAATFREVMSDFFADTSRLPNQRMRPYNPGSSKVPPSLDTSSAQHDEIAAWLMLEGGFNVNSVSEDAWIAVLSALRESEIETNAGLEGKQTGRTPLPRVRRPTDLNIDKLAINSRVTRWEGFRSLSDADIRLLAKELIREIRNRGPFLSLADFVNRRIGPDNDETNIKGAVQAALDQINVNQQAYFDGIELGAAQLGNHGYKSVRAGSGNNAAAAPGAITQGDVLTPLGSRITVRADTFRIRAYGEARDSSGNQVTARAWCEAIVQRVPAYVDPADDPSVRLPIPTDAASGTANQRFGRRFHITGFRWLDPSEV